MSDSALTIAAIYPDLLGTYGDTGNVTILAKRAGWRGYPVEVVTVDAGMPVPATADIYVLGGGEDAMQTRAAADLMDNPSFRSAADRGAVVFAICAGMQILGEHFPDATGTRRAGLALIDIATHTTEEPRAVGELLVEADQTPGLGLLTGFENHGGRTTVGPGCNPLGTVRAGVGNGDGTDGVLQGHIVGTYMHGPVLARNPVLADTLLRWATGDELTSLDDTVPEMLHRERVREATSGNSRTRMHVRGSIGRILGRS